MRRSTPAWALGLFLVVGGCAATGGTRPEGYGQGLAQRSGVLTPEVRGWLPEARRIAADALIIDTHIDVPWRLEKEPVDVTRATGDGDFDHPRAVAGGLDAPFMSIYIPAEVDAAGGGDTLPEGLMDVASYPHLVAGLLSRG